jgi:hypothetical protein
MRKTVVMFICFVFMMNIKYISAIEEQIPDTQKKTPLDQSGRTGVMIFSGYYGFWLGMMSYQAWAIKLKMKSRQEGKYIPVMPFITIPAGLISTHFLTKNRSITQAQTTIISMGAHLGTWQGTGWAAVADRSSKSQLSIGTFAGIAGIGAGLLTNHYIKFTAGGATFTHSAMFWGAWFGLVYGVLNSDKGDAILSDMLIGSDLLIFTTAILLKNSKISRKDVYGINAAGYVTGVLSWLAYFLITSEKIKDDYDGHTALAITCLGSVVGLTFGYWRSIEKTATNYYGSKTRKPGLNIIPQLKYQYHADNKNSFVPAICLHFSY